MKIKYIFKYLKQYTIGISMLSVIVLRHNIKEISKVELTESEINNEYYALSLIIKEKLHPIVGENLPKYAYIRIIHEHGINPTNDDLQIFAHNCACRGLDEINANYNQLKLRPWLCIMRDLKVALMLKAFLTYDMIDKLITTINQLNITQILSEDALYESKYTHMKVQNTQLLTRKLYNELLQLAC